jgi:alpha-L-fucosidase
MKTKNVYSRNLIIVLCGFYLFLLPLAMQGQNEPTSNVALQKKHTEFLKWEFGMFMHFNMGTFVNREWATGYEDPLLFAPKKLDCNQWAKAAKSAGMKYAVLTVKHTGGWCLWRSQYTTHGMQAFKNYKRGKGDIVREFVDAFRKQGLKVGFYYCLPGNYSTRCGNKEDMARGYKITKDEKDLHGLPPEAEGDYTGFIEKQITELLTNYGTIDEIWFDQYSNQYTGKDWQKIKALVHKLQPYCVLVANNSLDYTKTDVYSYEYPYWISSKKPEKAMPPVNNLNPGEVCDCIVDGPNWFWNNENPLKLQKAQDIVERLQTCNQRKANYLLNVQPDRDGLISGDHLKTLHEIGKIRNVK